MMKHDKVILLNIILLGKIVIIIYFDMFSLVIVLCYNARLMVAFQILLWLQIVKLSNQGLLLLSTYLR